MSNHYYYVGIKQSNTANASAEPTGHFALKVCARCYLVFLQPSVNDVFALAEGLHYFLCKATSYVRRRAYTAHYLPRQTLLLPASKIIISQ